MEMSEFAPGRPCWVDIGTDVEAAKTFYGGLFGWEGQDAGPAEETGGYGFFTLRGRMVAGYGPQQNPGPPAWNMYVATADLDATAAKVEESGGKIVMPPMDVMAAGRMAVFQDSTGAFFSAWQPGEHKGAGLWGEEGAVEWIEMNSRDPAGALEFYPQVFGWTSETHEGEMTYTEFASDGKQIAGMMAMHPMVPAEVPSHWLAYFGVGSAAGVDAGAEKVTNLGGAVMAGPMDIPGGGRFAVVGDPQGAVFGLYGKD